MITITLPWPSPKLSPNARVHWAQLAKAKKAAREVAADSLGRYALDHFEECAALDLKHVPMRWTFCPPTTTVPDRDNMIARCKAYQDGLADAMNANDKYFEPTYRFGPKTEGGAVIVEIGREAYAQKETEAPAQETHYPLQPERVLLTGDRP